MKILVFIEHDIIIRHFLYNNTFKFLADKHNVEFVFPKNGFNRIKTDITKLNLFKSKIHQVTINQRRIRIFKHLFRVEKLKFSNDPNSKKLKKIHSTMLDWKSRIFFTIYGLPIVNFFYKKFKYFQLKFIHTNKHLFNLINNFQPELIIHPSVLEGLFINDLALFANSSKIPFITIMNSWDNPSTKFNIVGKLDWLLVWGEQTRKHSEMFININKKKIIKFGSAQFEVYKEKPQKNKESFCKEYNIPIKNQILLYAGSSKGVDEFQHLVNLDNKIKNQELKNLTVIYRPHPWGKGGKNGYRILKHNWQNIIIEKNMLPYLERLKEFSNKIFLPQYSDTRDLLNSIDFIVSPLSTIILESAMMQKIPICYIPNDEKDARHLNLTKNLMHFEDMYNLKSFYKVENFDELVLTIKNIQNLKNSDKIQNQLKLDSEFFVKSHDNSYGLRLLNLCEKILQDNS